jgi:hypothetical protein
VSAYANPKYEGAYLAHKHINNHRFNIFPNHRLDIHHFGAGATMFDYNFAAAALEENRAMLGHAAIATASSGIAMGTMSVMADLGIDINTIGASNTAIELSSSMDWPRYMRVILSDLYLASVYA